MPVSVGDPFNEDYFLRSGGRAQAWLKGDRPFTFWRALRLLRKFKRGGKLLDVGCGVGHWLRRAERFYETYGLDVSRYATQETLRKTRTARVLVSDATVIPFRGASFDVVTAFDVLEHIREPNESVQELSRVLKPGGVLLISTPNLASASRALNGREWIGYRDKTHVSLLPVQAWSTLLRSRDLAVVRVFYDGLYDSPYLKRIPTLIQHFMFKVPMTILFGLGFPFPARLGEDVFILAVRQ